MEYNQRRVDTGSLSNIFLENGIWCIQKAKWWRRLKVESTLNPHSTAIKDGGVGRSGDYFRW
ncbi:MAG TPA: hypothetical protein DIT62_02670 [Alphaproteobacteria bacterium]|nr:hypothetical protein [Alphaproteobacteria bacterium]